MTLRTLGFCLLVLMLVPTVAPAASRRGGPAPAAPTTTAKPATPTGPQPTTWESYRVLSERNIFMRYRSRSSGGRSSSGYSPRPPAVTGEDYLVLTGIIQQGEDCVAFVEDTRSGKTARLQPGDPLGRGRVTLITRDIVHYAYDGDLRRIAIGANFAGVAVSLAKPATTIASAAPAATPPGAPAPASAAAPGAVLLGAGPPAPPPGAVPTAPGAAPPATPDGAPAAPVTAAAATPTTQPPAAPPQAAAGTSGGTQNAGAASVELQMRLRREQELNR